MSNSRILHFDYFRGLTIILVVAGHCYANWSINSIPEYAIVNMITGATAMFVFISGFFFSHIFYEKFEYSKFILSKAKNVLLPYVILSTISMAAMLIVSGEIRGFMEFSDNLAIQNIFAYFSNMLTGRTWTAYWYIPFVMIVFLASPIFIWYISKPMNFQIAIAFASFIIAMVVQRPTKGLNPLHSFIYFFGFYILGILYSQNKEYFDKFIKSNTYKIIMTAVAGSFFMAVLGQYGNMHKDFPWTWNGIDLMVPLKVTHIFAMLGLCFWLEKFKINWLTFIAKISFGIFFIHPIISNSIMRSNISNYLPGPAGSLVLFSVVFSLSLISSVLIKSYLGSRSRNLIGY